MLVVVFTCLPFLFNIDVIGNKILGIIYFDWFITSKYILCYILVNRQYYIQAKYFVDLHMFDKQ